MQLAAAQQRHSYRHAGGAELFGQFSGSIGGQRAGEEVADFDGPGAQLCRERGGVVAVAGEHRLEVVQSAREYLLDHTGGDGFGVDANGVLEGERQVHLGVRNRSARISIASASMS